MPKRFSVMQTGLYRSLALLAAPLMGGGKISREEKLIISLWSHTFLSYGDLIISVLPRVARILTSLNEAERNEVCLAFPFGGKPWAVEYAELLGIPRERQIDTLSETCAVAKGGAVLRSYTDIMAERANGDFSLYANCHPADYQQLRALLSLPKARPIRRLMIQRKGNRRLSHEQELLDAIRPLGFEMLEDKPRSVQEQIQIFSEAACVVAPHGASAANILWGSPQIRFMEVLSSTWMFPAFR